MLKGFGAAILLIFLGVVVVILTLGFETTDFATGAGEKALTALGTLFIIALFVERAQQVYIVAWRGLERSNIDTALVHAREDLAAAEQATPVVQATVDAAKKTLQTRTAAQETYRAETRKIAFIGGMLLGVLISLAGPRILSEVIVVHGDMGTLQEVIFNFTDILITGGLIGGGSEGIHKIVVLITDFLDKTREGFKSQQSGATGT